MGVERSNSGTVPFANGKFARNPRAGRICFGVSCCFAINSKAVAQPIKLRQAQVNKMLRRIVISQFSRPRGLLGDLVGFIMLNRPSNRRRNKWSVEQLGLKADSRVIEVGCGPGYALGLAAKIARSGKLTGLDHSEAMINSATRRLARHMNSGLIELLVADYTELRDFTETIDAIFSVNVIQFIDSHDEYFRLAYRALRPGGMTLSTYQPRMKNSVKADAERMAERLCESMTRQGFANVRIAWLDLKPVPAVSIIGQK